MSTPQQSGKSAKGIAAEQLSAGYANHTILKQINVELPHQQTTVLIGANGSGKSTLLKTLARIISPQQGQAVLDGKAIHQQPTREVAKQMSLLAQNPELPEGLTAFELVCRGRFPWQSLLRQWSDKDAQAVEQAMKLTGTVDFADQPVESLSGGQRQRCWIAMTLAQQTPYILLDEPTTFLDLRYQVEILELLRDLTLHQHKTVVMVLHDLNFALHYADRLVLMKQGQIAAVLDSAADCSPELIHSVFGLTTQLITNPHSGKPVVLPFPPEAQR